MYVDQSGKIEDKKMDTALAFSQEGQKAEEICKTVLIKKADKKQIKPKAISSLGSKEAYRLKLFSLGIFLLTENDLHRIKEVRVDKEYEGKRGKIKSYVYNFYREKTGYSKEDYPDITVREVHNLISDTPKCHQLSYKARERDIRPDFVAPWELIEGAMLPSPGKSRNTSKT